MKIIPGKHAANQKESIRLAFQTAGIDGMNADIIDMFTSLSDTDKISGEAEKAIVATIRSRYGSRTTWQAERWFVPIPKLHYDGKDIPQLIIEVSVYLVAAAVARTAQDSRFITLVGTVGKPETLTIPMVFLQAVCERDLGRFAIAARNAVYTTWEIPGAKLVRLSNDFINELGEMLRCQSVVAWLGDLGAQGRYLAPLVAGSLLGLAFRDYAQPVPVNKEIVTTAKLVSAMESIAYQPAEAKEMVRNAAPYLRADMTLEEGIRITLQVGKGGD
ncbi:hypothetical protein ACFLTZ_02910 [Chloroflexota bacterium]